MHPHKDIRKAIKYAESRGWTVRKAGGHAHIWGYMLCGFRDREGCRVNIMSTPRHPTNTPATFARK